MKLEDIQVGMRVRVARPAWRQVMGRVGTVVAITDPEREAPIRVQLDGWSRTYRFWPHEVQPADPAESASKTDRPDTGTPDWVSMLPAWAQDIVREIVQREVEPNDRALLRLLRLVTYTLGALRQIEHRGSLDEARAIARHIVSVIESGDLPPGQQAGSDPSFGSSE